MTPAPQRPHITVCICTYRRPAMLQRLLQSVREQKTGGAFSFSIVVADNDADRSAEKLVLDFAAKTGLPVLYCCEPEKNIARVRNRALEAARGEFIAFIDDDEFPTEGWLAELLSTCQRTKAAGVLGPVRPHFEQEPPAWIIKGRFCERPEHPTGTVMEWQKCRTGNVLFRRSIIEDLALPFDPVFGTGGEDQDFFRRMASNGAVFVWCNEAPVYETVPPNRWTRSYMLKRALLRGRNGLKHPSGRFQLVARSLIAVPLYSLAMPFTLLAGQHIFMNVTIRFCDHFGRLMALLGLNLVEERQM